MCNACGNLCCGSDEFGGCDHCDCPECWSSGCDLCGQDEEDCLCGLEDGDWEVFI